MANGSAGISNWRNDMVEFIIIAVLALYCGWVIRKKVKDIKAGGCGCGCSGCAGCTSCGTREEE